MKPDPSLRGPGLPLSVLCCLLDPSAWPTLQRAMEWGLIYNTQPNPTFLHFSSAQPLYGSSLRRITRRSSTLRVVDKSCAGKISVLPLSCMIPIHNDLCPCAARTNARTTPYGMVTPTGTYSLASTITISALCLASSNRS